MKVEKIRLSELEVGDLYTHIAIVDAHYAITLSELHVVLQKPFTSIGVGKESLAIEVYRITLKEDKS